MSRTNYVTDSFSTSLGLSAVAYGSADFLSEVRDQIRSGYDVQVPSALIEQVLNIDKLVELLEEEYEGGGEFTDYVDGGNLTVRVVGEKIKREVGEAINSLSGYEYSFTDLFSPEYGLEGAGFAQKLFDALPDLNLYVKDAVINPLNKLDKLNPNSTITLKDSIPLGKDLRGNDFNLGYLTLTQYVEDVAYPGVSDVFENLPISIIDSIKQGYSGYAVTTPLDSGVNLTTRDISDIAGIPRSIFGLGTIDTLKDLTGFSSMSESDRAMYSVDLSELIIAKNGYTTYDPLKDSNGDFLAEPVSFDQLNSDPELGRSTRNNSTPF